MLRGIPADISWRLTARARNLRHVGPGVSTILKSSTTVLVVLVGLFNVWAAVVAWSADGGGARYTAPQLIAAAMVGLGLYQRRSPSATLLILGGAAIPIAVFP